MKPLELKIYGILKTRFSEEEAETFIEYFESKTNEKIEDKKDVFLTKQDKVDLLEKINTVKIDMIEKMNKDKIDLIKWMFGFWITIVLLLLANWFLKT